MAGRWAAALVVLLLVGCGPARPTPSPTSLEHATGERDLVLRMAVGGGLPNPGLTIERPPGFSLYGDGRIIHRVSATATDGTSTSELRQARLGDAQVDDLLRMALAEGGLATAAERYASDLIFDAGTTTFTINAGGVSKTVSVYALGYLDDLTPNARERAGFRALVDRIAAATGAAGDLGPFAPEAYRVMLFEPFSDMAVNASWPWPDLVPADFMLLDNGARTRIVTPVQGEAVLSLGITQDLVTRAADGQTYMVQIQPLLPDEVPQA